MMKDCPLCQLELIEQQQWCCTRLGGVTGAKLVPKGIKISGVGAPTANLVLKGN
ncbi:hypothetical protein [Paenibacillus antibioticophila]|uniref:hypothetical protein n=1 Tax=Paenibacillus antibioticophila TaxID=1274374 RepID=UPI000A69344C|nr:hypothetical protein [Paenibacillus antibioticophila]